MILKESWNVGAILSTTEDFFKKRGIDTARLDAELILAHTLDLPRERLLAGRERRLTDIEISAFRERVRQRAGHKPVAYLLNKKEFFSLPFYVDEHVLIPRPETEHLVEQASRWIAHQSKIKNLKSKIQVCEIGAGSGCIASALARARPECSITATEISGPAARIAVKNVAALGLLGRVRILHRNLFPFPSDLRFDLIVSNPPYLSLEEFEALPPAIRRFEPRLALTDEGDGLTVYRRIFRSAARHIRPDGALFLEVSPRIAAALESGGLLENSPLRLAALHPDLAGLPRVAELRFTAPARHQTVSC